ncbi:MAG: 2-keto-4-pentenoate hydratase [Acetobacteraceae bacterium]|nr:2-keto-4-pentenoate hydratase [Acetobacteraceae bacterium]
MDQALIKQAAAALVEARRTMMPLAGLPAGTSPTTTADAHAIQDETTAQLGQAVVAYKAMAPATGDATRGLIYAGTVHAAPAAIPARLVPQCGVEGEVAFIFRKDLPRRATPYTREEVAAAVDALAAIEVVHGRFPVDAAVSGLDKLADSISNGALVCGEPKADWRSLDLGKLRVTLDVNGAPVLGQIGGHPTGDPLGVAVVLVNMLPNGVKAGQYVTCGSCTGLRYLTPGDTCTVKFAGLGEAEVVFKP